MISISSSSKSLTPNNQVVFSELKAIMQNSFDAARSLEGGKLANYIPELAKVNPELFAASFIPIKNCQKIEDAAPMHFGDFSRPFTLQSTSKPFSYAFLSHLLGEKIVHRKIGVEPSGEAFNSIVELEKKYNRPFNPMINSGAIAVAGLLLDTLGDQAQEKTLEFFSELAGEKLKINQAVFLSEKQTAHRNRSIAHLLRSFDIIGDRIEEALDLYFLLCSLEVNTKSLAQMTLNLVDDSLHTLSPEIKRNTQSLMFTCGMYDSSGEWAFEVGLPGKSGVSGGLLVTIPHVGVLATYSPKINEYGHSVRSEYFVKSVIKTLNWHIFN